MSIKEAWDFSIPVDNGWKFSAVNNIDELVEMATARSNAQASDIFHTVDSGGGTANTPQQKDYAQHKKAMFMYLKAASRIIDRKGYGELQFDLFPADGQAGRVSIIDSSGDGDPVITGELFDVEGG